MKLPWKTAQNPDWGKGEWIIFDTALSTDKNSIIGEKERDQGVENKLH